MSRRKSKRGPSSRRHPNVLRAAYATCRGSRICLSPHKTSCERCVPELKSVGVDGPMQFRALEPCIREMLGRWAFPPASEEYGTEFSYLFQGNE